MKKIILQPKRQYGIDLLRMISMMMIVVNHTLRRSSLLDITPLGSASHEVLWAVEVLCYGAVDCFVLISGYVGWKGKFKASRLIHLWLQVVFYTLGFELLYQAITGNWNALGLLQACFPTVRSTYWFFTQYMALCLLMPFLNRLIQGQTLRQNRRMVVVLLLLLSVTESVAASPLSLVGGTSDLFSLSRGYCLMWFIVLYLCGAAIGRRKAEETGASRSPWLWFAVFVGTNAGTWLIRFAEEQIQGKESAWYAVNYTAPLMVLGAIALLLWSASLHLPERAKRWIAFLSPGTFGVYLIHSNPRVYAVYVEAVSGLSSLHLIEKLLVLALIGIGVFLVCDVADLGREWLFRHIGVPKFGAWLDRKIELRDKEVGQ